MSLFHHLLRLYLYCVRLYQILSQTASGQLLALWLYLLKLSSVLCLFLASVNLFFALGEVIQPFKDVPLLDFAAITLLVVSVDHSLSQRNMGGKGMNSIFLWFAFH